MTSGLTRSQTHKLRPRASSVRSCQVTLALNHGPEAPWRQSAGVWTTDVGAVQILLLMAFPFQKRVARTFSEPEAIFLSSYGSLQGVSFSKMETVGFQLCLGCLGIQPDARTHSRPLLARDPQEGCWQGRRSSFQWRVPSARRFA